jgi:hypothetical protein
LRMRTSAALDGRYGLTAKGGRSIRQFNESLVSGVDVNKVTLKISTESSGVKGIIEVPGKVEVTVYVRSKNPTSAILQRVNDSLGAIFGRFKLKGDFSQTAISQMHRDIRQTVKTLGLDGAETELQFRSEAGDYFLVDHDVDKGEIIRLAAQ